MGQGGQRSASSILVDVRANHPLVVADSIAAKLLPVSNAEVQNNLKTAKIK